VSATDDARERALARFAAMQGGANDGTPPAPDEAAHLEQMDEVWRGLDAMADNPALLEMRAQARARFDRHPAAPRHGWRVASVAALAASLVAVVGLGWAYRQGQSLPLQPSGGAPTEQVIANGRQLPRAVQLADGTSVTLDSQTRLRVASGGRAVRLEYGRAFFAVHHDAAHPFAVQVGDMTVNDIGTRFEVRQEPGATSVTLLEGKVRVVRSGETTDMVPGTRLMLRGGHVAVAPLDAAHQTVWQSGMISAEDSPVRDIVAQFNRYLARPLVITDPAVGALKISGEFRLDDPQGFVNAIAAMGKGGITISPTP
jgi:transmembrane sensor